MIKAVIFDVGDTLTFNDWRARLKGVEKDTGVTTWFTDKTKIARDKASTGEIRMEDALKVILEENGNKVSLKIFIDSYKRNFMKYTTLNKEMVQLVKKISARYNVYAFSNTNNLHASITKKRGVYKLFKRVFLSHKIKSKKPEEKAFSYVMAHIKEEPKEIVFIDDNKDNLKVAEKMGLHTIHFTNLSSLKKELKTLEVVI